MKILWGGGGKIKFYKKLTKTLGLEKNVIYLAQDIEKIYAIADIFVFPTLSDPCAMAPIEAMACRVATIMSSTQYAGSAEHVTDGEALII